LEGILEQTESILTQIRDGQFGSERAEYQLGERIRYTRFRVPEGITRPTNNQLLVEVQTLHNSSEFIEARRHLLNEIRDGHTTSHQFYNSDPREREAFGSNRTVITQGSSQARRLDRIARKNMEAIAAGNDPRARAVLQTRGEAIRVQIAQGQSIDVEFPRDVNAPDISNESVFVSEVRFLVTAADFVAVDGISDVFYNSYSTIYDTMNSFIGTGAEQLNDLLMIWSNKYFDSARVHYEVALDLGPVAGMGRTTMAVSHTVAASALLYAANFGPTSIGDFVSGSAITDLNNAGLITMKNQHLINHTLQLLPELEADFLEEEIKKALYRALFQSPGFFQLF
jgi:hypothetical protein